MEDLSCDSVLWVIVMDCFSHQVLNLKAVLFTLGAVSWLRIWSHQLCINKDLTLVSQTLEAAPPGKHALCTELSWCHIWATDDTGRGGA